MKFETLILLISFIISIILGVIIIPILRKLKVGQIERDDGPQSHLKKQGTPTMGGIIVIITMILVVTGAYIFLSMQSQNETANRLIPMLILTIGYGLIGFIDDFKKLVLKNTEGLNPKLKMFGLLIIATIFTIYLSNVIKLGTDILIPFTGYRITLPTWIYIPFTILVMLAATNAVNLTDGIDGLAATVLTIITVTLTIISARYEEFGVATFSTIVAGSCAGFLVYNVYKAKVFMGDTGSLLLGGVISSIAIYIKNPLILLIVAIVPIAETLSVIMQVISFRFTGKRMFRMAPLHHHFELSGWRENKVVVVFGFITLVFCVLGVLGA